MLLAFLLGSAEISGGTYVIFEHATRLNRFGCKVTIVTEDEVKEHSYAWHPAARELNWQTYAEVRDTVFDVAIATWWQSVYQLPRISSKRYLYFVQSIESRFFEAQDPEDPGLRDVDILSQWCENSYRISLPVITEAKWIQRYLLEHHNRPSILVRNGIRKDLYTPEGSSVAPRAPGSLRVLVEGPLGVFFKNVEKTIELCLRAGGCEVWLLTSSRVDEYTGVTRCFSQIPVHETPKIYRSCDILVKLSYVEGMFGPPLEMFHCGGTALVYSVTGHDEYIRHGMNSLVVERDDEDQVVAWLQILQNDRDLLQKLKHGALRTASEWPDWDVTAEQFFQALKSVERDQPQVHPSFIKESCQYFLSVRDAELASREMSRFIERERQGPDSAIRRWNAIQVYWDCGRGMEKVLTDRYESGIWCRCRVVVPSEEPLQVLRIDPSVRIGFVEVRSLLISTLSGQKIACWQAGGAWHDIVATGTAVVLNAAPYPVLWAYGEDPQLFLPQLVNATPGEHITVELEVREWSVAQTMMFFSQWHKGETSPGLKERLSRIFRGGC